MPRVPEARETWLSVAVEQAAAIATGGYPAGQGAVLVDERQPALDPLHQAGVDGEQQLVAGFEP